MSTRLRYNREVCVNRRRTVLYVPNQSTIQQRPIVQLWIVIAAVLVVSIFKTTTTIYPWTIVSAYQVRSYHSHSSGGDHHKSSLFYTMKQTTHVSFTATIPHHHSLCNQYLYAPAKQVTVLSRHRFTLMASTDTTSNLLPNHEVGDMDSEPRQSPSPQDGVMYVMGVNLARQLGDIRPLLVSPDETKQYVQELSQVTAGIVDTLIGRVDEAQQIALLQQHGNALNALIQERA